MNDNLSEVVSINSNPELLKPFIQPDAVRLDSPNPLEPLVVHKSETDAKSSNKPTKKKPKSGTGCPKKHGNSVTNSISLTLLT